MKIFECKCGSKEIFIEENGNNKGLYCADCGKWIQWLGKDDLRLAKRQIEQMSKANEIYNQALEDVMKIYNEMQPQLATRVYEFGERIERLKK